MSAHRLEQKKTMRVRMVKSRKPQVARADACSRDLFELFADLPEQAAIHFTDEHGYQMRYDGHFLPMADVLRDGSKRLALCAASQTGKSQGFIVKILWLLNGMPVTLMYILPTEPDRDDFFQARWSPMVHASKWLQDRVGASGTKVSRVGLQSIKGDAGVSTMYFLATGSKSAGIGRASDGIFVDEVDLCNPGTIGKMQGRTGASPLDVRWYVSNPTLEGEGIAERLAQSDWKRWFIPCPRCGEWQDLLAHYPQCIEGEPPNARYVCCECNAEIRDADRLAGGWRPTQVGDFEYSGYQISRLDTTLHSANRILLDVREYMTNPHIMTPQKHIANFILGKPWSSGAGAISWAMIRTAIQRGGGKPMFERAHQKGWNRMRAGVDVHRDHFFVTVCDGPRVVLIKKLRRETDSWQCLADLADNMGIGCMVVDAMPEQKQSEEFCVKMGGRAYRCWYAPNGLKTAEIQYDSTRRYNITVDRTSALDSVGEFIGGPECMLPGDDEIIPEFGDHLTQGLKRVLVTEKAKQLGEKGDEIVDRDQGRARYHYVTSGTTGDHWYHSMGYMMLACRLLPSGGMAEIAMAGRMR